MKKKLAIRLPMQTAFAQAQRRGRTVAGYAAAGRARGVGFNGTKMPAEVRFGPIRMDDRHDHSGHHGNHLVIPAHTQRWQIIAHVAALAVPAAWGV